MGLEPALESESDLALGLDLALESDLDLALELALELEVDLPQTGHAKGEDKYMEPTRA